METSEKILFKAFELFKRYGIRSVTMDEIAGQCGVSKKTVYQFFEDKDTLVENIMLDFINKSQQSCEKQQVHSDNAIEEIFLSMDMVQQMIEGVNPALLNDLRKYHSTAFAKLQQHKDDFMYDFVKKNIERGIVEGLYRSDIKLDIITSFYLHSITLPIEYDILPKSKYTIADLDAEITLFLLYGLANAKGIKLIDKYKQQRIKLHTV
jgi:TetR/AcrR family transcriptional regulator, cholesterol catabolism regulator